MFCSIVFRIFFCNSLIMDNRQILHIDFDSFFASVEQQYDPKLRRRPIGVTARNGRTCIIASSREAKVLGIKTGMRTYDAKKICPKIIFVPSDFVKYFEVSKKFLNICKDYSPFVELFSIDELFMDITLTSPLFGGVYGIVEKIKARIREEIGERITASVGISHNKLLAKLASSIKKPNGIFELRKQDIDDVYKNVKLTDICGIGERINERLDKIGVHNLMDLRKTSLAFLIAEFGLAEAKFLHLAGLGIDESAIIPYTQAPQVKSVGRNYCLPKNEYDKKIVLQNIFELCEEIGIKLRRLNKRARTGGLYLRGNINFHGRKTYQRYFNTGKEIFDLCNSLLSSRLEDGNSMYVRQIGVWVSNLEDRKNIPLSLFDSPKASCLQKAIDKINERFGNHTIRNGFLLYADKLTTVPNGYLADKYERFKLSRSI